MSPGLTDRAKDRAATFSGGMKRRLNLAAALMHEPAILLLDEPTVGVDPQSRNAIFANLEELKRQGKTLVYTTHYMEEAERLCDRIIIIDHGKVIANDTPGRGAAAGAGGQRAGDRRGESGRGRLDGRLARAAGRASGGVGRRSAARHGGRTCWTIRRRCCCGCASMATAARTSPASAPTWKRCS